MLDAPRIRFAAKPAAHLPIEELIVGKSRLEVAELLPRLFNLCRTAQGLAVRAALDLPAEDDMAALRQEIVRDHVLRLSVVLPRHFGPSPIRLPEGWQGGGAALRQALFGPSGRLPETPGDFENFLTSGAGIAGLWARVADLFAYDKVTGEERDEGISKALPFVSAKTAADPDARVENSCAVRVADHPVVAHLADNAGQNRSLLWRLVARSYDLEALLGHAPLTLATPHRGRAHVSATRGLYTVSAEHDGEKVTRFARVTPTDHLRAPGGVLDQVLATIPTERAAVLPVAMDILDPCSPISVEEVAHA